MIKEYCFYINDIKFSDKDFSKLFVDLLNISTPLLRLSLRKHDMAVDKYIQKCSHQILFLIDGIPFIRIRIFRTEEQINQYTETMKYIDYTMAITALINQSILQYVNLLDEAKNARKH